MVYLPDLSYAENIQLSMAKNISDTQNYTCPKPNFVLVDLRVRDKTKGQKLKLRVFL